MRAVLDPNVIISAALSPSGSPGRVFRYWLEGYYDLIVSANLLDELRRALTYPRLRDRITPAEADELVELLSRAGVVIEDPDTQPNISSPDPDDDYLIALASHTRSILASGDRDLLQLSNRLPIKSPFDFASLIEGEPPGTT